MQKTSPTEQECSIGMLTHLLGVFTGILGALVIWLMKKGESGFVAQEAKEALNFQISVLLAFLASCVLAYILIGYLLMLLLFLANMVCCVVAAVSASKGIGYRYPIALRLVK